MSNREKVLVVLEDQHDDGSRGSSLNEPRIVWKDSLSYYAYGKEIDFGVEFVTPDGRTFMVPEGSTVRVVKLGIKPRN